MKPLGKRTKLLLMALVIVIVVILLTIVFLPSILKFGNNLTVQYYDLNQEIAEFPTGNTSITFTSWAYTSSFGIFEASENTNLIILNFTLRNIASNEIETRTSLQYLPAAEPFTPREAPLLKYGDSYVQAKTDFPYAHYWRLWKPQTTLLPNESIKGCLIYEILKENPPAELVYPNKESPQIIIRLQ
jgi:hypothetical protein